MTAAAGGRDVLAGATAGGTTDRGVGLLAFVLLGTSMVVVSLVGLLSVELTRDLGFGEAGLGVAVSSFWLVTAVAAPLAGRWVDRRGWPVGAVLGALVTAVCLAASVLLVTSWAGLLLVLAAAGLGYALSSPTSNLLVMAAVPVRRQASVLGFKQTAPPLLLAAAGATLPAVAHEHGWRAAMGIGLLLPALVLVGVGLLARRLEPAVGPGGPVDLARSGPSGRSGSAVGSRPAPLRTLPVVVAAGLGTLSVATVTGFAVLTLVDAGLPAVRAAAVVSVGSLLAVAARIGSGRLLDHRPPDDVGPLVVVMSLAVVALLAVAAGVALPDATWLVVAGVVGTLVAAWTWPALLLLTVVRLAAGPGAASGRLQLGSGLGSAIGPTAFGVLAEAGDPGWAWLVMAVATAVAIVLVRRACRPARSGRRRSTV